jgi:uncharacterized protein (UPF0276 family)
MQLAINYSHPAARLIDQGKIQVDYFKVPNWDWMIKEAKQLRPVAVHFSLEAGNGELGRVDWENIIRTADSTQTPFINLHLDARQGYYPQFSVNTTVEEETQQIISTILSDVTRAIHQCGAERVIIENSPYQGKDAGTMQVCIQPAIIRQVTEQTGCGFLLDISHAIISARALSMEPDDYMLELPVNKIKELHFAGVQYNQFSGTWMDHLSITEEDWSWLEWVLQHIRTGEWSHPWLLAFEYGGVGELFEWRSDPQVMFEQVPRLSEMLIR